MNDLHATDYLLLLEKSLENAAILKGSHPLTMYAGSNVPRDYVLNKQDVLDCIGEIKQQLWRLWILKSYLTEADREKLTLHARKLSIDCEVWIGSYDRQVCQRCPPKMPASEVEL